MPAIIQMPSQVKRPPVDLYPKLNFPPYQFVQFPEWVTAPEGWKPSGGEEIDRSEPGVVKVLVHDEEEKGRLLAGGVVLSGDVDEKAELLALAASKGIPWDNRWSVETARRKVGA